MMMFRHHCFFLLWWHSGWIGNLLVNLERGDFCTIELLIALFAGTVNFPDVREQDLFHLEKITVLFTAG
jgi:hypothetical protein